MNLAKIGAVALVALVLGIAWKLGVFARVAEPKVLAQTLVELGLWGYFAYLVAFSVLQPFGVPGTIFVVAAPLIWPWHTAFALSMIGTMAASVVGFSFARFVARDWVTKRIPARLKKYDEALERNAFSMVVILRMVFWMPVWLHAFLGVSKVRFSTHFWASLIGYAPPLLAVSVLGASLFDADGNLQREAWPMMIGMLAVTVVIALVGRYFLSRATRHPPAAENPQ